MADALTLYTNPKSRGLIAMWMMEEIGQPFEAVVMEYGAPMRTPEYLALNPMGKVPVLKHGDAIVTETAAICAYMAETFPEAGLAPRPESAPTITAGCSLRRGHWKPRFRRARWGLRHLPSGADMSAMATMRPPSPRWKPSSRHPTMWQAGVSRRPMSTSVHR